MTFKKKELLAIAVIAVIAVSGYLAYQHFFAPKEEIPSLNELLPKISAASKKIKAYAFELTVKSTFGNKRFTMYGEGKVDLEAEKMHMVLTLEVEGSSFKQEMYLIGTTAYIKVFGMWYKQAYPEDFWEEARRMGEKSLEIIKKSKASVKGVEVIDGVKAYKIEIILTEETAKEALKIAMGGTFYSTSAMIKEMGFKEVKVIEWVDTENYYLIKTYCIMRGSKKDPSTGKTIDITIEVEYKFSDINKPVQIVLPEEAKGAKEIPGFGGS